VALRDLFDGLCKFEGPEEELWHVDAAIALNTNRKVVEVHLKLLLLATRMRVKCAGARCVAPLQAPRPPDVTLPHPRLSPRD